MPYAPHTFQNLIGHAAAYGFIFQSSDIYDGLAAVYDYGQNGAQLKKNIRDAWWKSMTQLNDNIVGIDAAIFMHPTTWKASGHVDSFSDPMIDNKDSNKRYRVDHLIEAHAEKLQAEGKADLAASILAEMEKLLAADDLNGIKTLIVDNKMVCGTSGTANWTDVRQFNLMFSTELGSVAEEASTIYLRPETAQGIFVNFLNVQKSGRLKIPFGIAQTGKAFRNEIVARQFIFRMREFEQMEMQFFVRPGTQKEWYQHWKAQRRQWHIDVMGFPEDRLKFHDHVKLAHYADAAVDIEFEFPFGFKELEGIHSRTDYDLGRHQEFSKKKQQYFDTEINQNYVPFVVETSVGLDRLVLATLSHAYAEESWTKEDGSPDSRVVLRLPANLAPIKLAVLPLTKKDGLPELARQLMDSCKTAFHCFYEEKDTIGKRYRRMDALGTPFCVTIDHQTKEDGTVTIRYRDTMTQQRMALTDVKAAVLAAITV
ncbi:MAG: glycine--tRNA ligase [Bacteroidetes bacterium]|nr:MAG: glycine--tRNA ligase [Bacteroidota bacterium]